MMDHDHGNESLDRALADIEMLQAAYPDEIDVPITYATEIKRQFPLHVTLRLDDDDGVVAAPSSSSSSIRLEFIDGYPVQSGVQIASYRSPEKDRIDAVARAVRLVAEECLQDGIEGGLACCATAMQTWQDYDGGQEDRQQQHEERVSKTKTTAVDSIPQRLMPSRQYEWITGEPLMDRKSIFLAHVCRVTSEIEVRESLDQLLFSSSKIQRATHNMYAWRLTEVLGNQTKVLKHDNFDDGEDAAGSRMALLLHQRNEDCVIVVVSRWFGGVHLGPKRFAHIVNVSRDLLIHCHEHVWKQK
jgi:hypothetical protein